MPDYTNPGASVALSWTRPSPEVRKALRDPEARAAHRAALVRYLAWGLKWSENKGRLAAWTASSSQFIESKLRLDSEFLVRENGRDGKPITDPAKRAAAIERDRLKVIRYANQVADLSSYLFSKWGHPAFFNTALGRVVGRFRSWIPQDHELYMRIYEPSQLIRSGLKAVPGDIVDTLGGPFNLASMQGRRGDMQKRWLEAQYAAMTLSGMARVGSHIGVGPSTLPALVYGIWTQLGYGFSKNAMSPGVDQALAIVIIGQRLAQLNNATDDEAREIMRSLDEMQRQLGQLTSTLRLCSATADSSPSRVEVHCRDGWQGRRWYPIRKHARRPGWRNPWSRVDALLEKNTRPGVGFPTPRPGDTG